MLNVKATRKRGTRKRNASAQKRITTVVTTQPVVPVNNRKSRRRRRGLGRRNKGIVQPQLSECAYEFAKAIADPWSAAALSACIPSPAGPTQRVTGWIRGTTVIGSGGYAVILVSPCVSNDTACIFHTNSSYTSSVGQANLIAGGTIQAGWTRLQCSNLLYTSATMLSNSISWQPTISARIVSAGLKVWYTGKATNQAGLMYGLRDPQHMSVQMAPITTVAMRAADLGLRRETQIVNNDRQGLVIVDFASDVEETDMTSYARRRASSQDDNIGKTWTLYPFSHGESKLCDVAGSAYSSYLDTSSNVLMGIPSMNVTVNGTAGESISFEYVIHIEYGGAAASSFGVRSPVDPIGMQRVLDAASDVQSDGTVKTRSEYWNKMMSALREIQARAAPHAMNLLRNAGRSYLMGQMQRSITYQGAMAAAAANDQKSDDETEPHDVDTPRRRSSMVYVKEPQSPERFV